MYKIKFLPSKMMYQLLAAKGNSYEGTLYSITKKAMELGIEQSELIMAYETMAKNEDTVADFGINGTFMYSTKGDVK